MERFNSSTIIYKSWHLSFLDPRATQKQVTPRCMIWRFGGSEKSQFRKKSEMADGRSLYSVASGSTFFFNHSRNDLLQVSDVTNALGRCHSFPKILDSSNKFIFSLWFHLPVHVFFQLMPKVLSWVEIWRFRRCSPPVVSLKECDCPLQGMFQVIVYTSLCKLKYLGFPLGG